MYEATHKRKFATYDQRKNITAFHVVTERVNLRICQFKHKKQHVAPVDHKVEKTFVF